MSVVDRSHLADELSAWKAYLESRVVPYSLPARPMEHVLADAIAALRTAVVEPTGSQKPELPTKLGDPSPASRVSGPPLADLIPSSTNLISDSVGQNEKPRGWNINTNDRQQTVFGTDTLAADPARLTAAARIDFAAIGSVSLDSMRAFTYDEYADLNQGRRGPPHPKMRLARNYEFGRWPDGETPVELFDARRYLECLHACICAASRVPPASELLRDEGLLHELCHLALGIEISTHNSLAQLRMEVVGLTSMADEIETKSALIQADKPWLRK